MKRTIGLTLCASFVMGFALLAAGSAQAQSPTDGWTQRTFTFGLHTPWDKPRSERYRESGGVHSLWIFPNDKPFQPPPKTGGPRSEMRWNNNYTSGQRMFDADVWVVRNTESTVIQVFGGQTHATASQIRSFRDGTLRRYNSGVVARNAFEKWINIKMAHNTKGSAQGDVAIYVNDVFQRRDVDRGNNTHYFKNGVYGCGTSRCESRFRNIKIWVR